VRDVGCGGGVAAEEGLCGDGKEFNEGAGSNEEGAVGADGDGGGMVLAELQGRGRG